LRFVQELRQRGDTDLALELLNRLEKNAKDNPSSAYAQQISRELPFEKALIRKAEAINEPDSNQRLKLYAQAREELVKFGTANPNPPRIGEIKIDIADIRVLEGKTEMGRALAQPDVDTQQAELDKSRKKFEEAGKELKAIVTDLQGQYERLKD